MIRRTAILAFVTLTVLSASLALSAAALWARSVWVMDSVYLERFGYGWQATSVRGQLIIVRRPATWKTKLVHRGAYSLAKGGQVFTSVALDKNEGTKLKVGPFFWGSLDASLPPAARFMDMRGWKWMGIPHAAIIVPFSILPALLIIRLGRQRRRRLRGQCRHCGYDLRASPERCPECGAGVTGISRGRAVSRGA